MNFWPSAVAQVSPMTDLYLLLMAQDRRGFFFQVGVSASCLRGSWWTVETISLKLSWKWVLFLIADTCRSFLHYWIKRIRWKFRNNYGLGVFVLGLVLLLGWDKRGLCLVIEIEVKVWCFSIFKSKQNWYRYMRIFFNKYQIISWSALIKVCIALPLWKYSNFLT